MARWIQVDERINQYITAHLEPEEEVLRALHRETSTMAGASMQISHEQARFMSLFLKAMGARHTIEIGVFTGYSTLVTALALPDDGHVLACDISEEWTTIARRYWAKAGVAQKIELRLAPAEVTLKRLLAEGRAGSYDFVVIDADKTGYDAYYELSLQLLRPGGVSALDNCLWGGAVVDAEDRDGDPVAIRSLNDKIARDTRVHSSLLPIGDGLFLVYKRQ